MMELLLVVGVVWFLGALLWSRVYYARRHGLGWGVDFAAAFIGMAWPLTIFTHWNPDLCSHRAHALERHELLQQYEAEEQIMSQMRQRER